MSAKASLVLEDFTNYNVQYFADAYGYDVELVNRFLQNVKVGNSKTIQQFREVFDILHLIGSSLGALSNLLFIVVLCNTTGKLKSSLKLLLSLAVSDFFQSCLNILTHVFSFDTLYRQSNARVTTPVDEYIAQKILSDLFLLTDATGHFILVILAVDILLAVRKPFLYKILMSKRRINLVIEIMWATCFLLVACSTVIIEMLRIQTTEDGLDIWNLGVGYSRVYLYIRQCQDVVFLTIVGMYIGIALELRKLRLRKLSVAKRTKLALVLGTIVLCYMFCNCPFVTTAFEVINSELGELVNAAPYVSNTIYVSSAYRAFLNSVVYAARLPDVRSETKRCCMNISFNRKEKWRKQVRSVASTLRTLVGSETTSGTRSDNK